MQRNPATLLQILNAARLVVTFAAGIDAEAFRADVMRQSAMQHQILIIGEAVSRLSPDFLQAHPDIPWMLMKRMCNIIVHRYDMVDLTIIWNVATRDAPALIALIEPLVQGDSGA